VLSENTGTILVSQGLSHCLDTPGGHGGGVAVGWCHEVRRAFLEGLCRVSDVEWLEGFINSLGRKVCVDF